MYVRVCWRVLMPRDGFSPDRDGDTCMEYAIVNMIQFLQTHSRNVFFCWHNVLLILKRNTVGHATTNNDTTNECYIEQFLSIKSGCYNEHRCYNERGRILSADVTRACA